MPLYCRLPKRDPCRRGSVLPRDQHASRLFAAIERQPLMGPDLPSAGAVGRPLGPAVLHFPCTALA